MDTIQFQFLLDTIGIKYLMKEYLAQHIRTKTRYIKICKKKMKHHKQWPIHFAHIPIFPICKIFPFNNFHGFYLVFHFSIHKFSFNGLQWMNVLKTHIFRGKKCRPTNHWGHRSMQAVYALLHVSATEMNEFKIKAHLYIIVTKMAYQDVLV